MPSPELPSGPVSLDTIGQLLPSEWVLVKVTNVDLQGVITHGEILDHSLQRRKLNKMVKLLQERDPDAHISIFLGGTKFGAGEDLRRALVEAAEHDELDGRW